MKNRKKYARNPLFQLCLVSLLSGCGGGGGGGASNLPRSIEPVKIINIPEGEKREENSRKISRATLPSNPTYDTPIIPQVASKGEGLVAGVLDSNFLEHKEKLEKKYGDKILILEKQDSSYTDHGEIVLETFTNGITPKVVVASLGTKKDNQDIIRFSLGDYKKILEEMKKADTQDEKKLKVFNQSWGSTLTAQREKELYSNRAEFRKELLKAMSEVEIGLLEELEKAGQKSLDFYDEAVNKENGLFVWANGNYDLKDQELYHAGIQAAAPFGKSNLEKGWISVVGVDGNRNNANYYPKHLAYSGVASNWSISANGNAGGKYGSSFAAPRVANAAIQVGSKFPWMTNNDVRMTLFTTTNKVGVGDGLEEEKRFTSSEPTTTNGWGVLNTERALKGPGAFWKLLLAKDSNNVDTQDWKYYFNANIPKDTTSYFENNIHGDSGLKKKGEGTLVLTGKNDFEGKTKIEDGKVEIYKTHSSGIDIGKAGTLVLHNNSVVGYHKSVIGDEEKFSPVVNEGTLQVSGKESFVGEYVNKTGKLDIPQGSHLTILNKANIDNLVVNLEAKDYVSRNGETKEILQAKNIVGDVKDVTVDGMRSAVVEKQGDKLVATVSRESAVNYLGEAGESSKDTAGKIENTLKELDKKYQTGTLNENDKELGTTILAMSTDEFKKSTEIVSGEIYASAQALNFLQAQNVNRGISNHLASLKSFYDSDFEWQGWASFQNTNGRLSEDGYSTADTKINGGNFGIDKRVGSNQLGVAISYSNGRADFDRYAGNYKSDSVGVSLYGKRYFLDNSYILSRVGVTNFDTEVNRTLLAQDGSTQNGNIKHNDLMYSGYVEIGKHFDYFTPYIGYSIDRLERDGFNESSASWGIVADKKSYTQQNIVFGIHSEYDVNSSLRLTSHITQQINIGDRDLSFNGRFTNSSNEYRFKGINQVQNTTWVGVGAEKAITENFGVGINLDLRLNEYKKEDVQVSTNLYYRF